MPKKNHQYEAGKDAVERAARRAPEFPSRTVAVWPRRKDREVPTIVLVQGFTLNLFEQRKAALH